MDDVLELNETDKITGEIYKITNVKTQMCYIGQTRSHRKNKTKYRRFGFLGRFKDHISEALNNTKKNQCKYLNNAIRMSKDDFTVELLESCKVQELDERERYYISFYHSLYPTGYNLTSGGSTLESVSVELNSPLEPTKKRGRNAGFNHTDETKAKMKESLGRMSSRLKQMASTDERKDKVSTTIKEYYDNHKVQRLLECDISGTPDQYIKEIRDKSGVVCDYKIYINREIRFRTKSTRDSLEEKYRRLVNILIQAKELKRENG